MIPQTTKYSKKLELVDMSIAQTKLAAEMENVY